MKQSIRICGCHGALDEDQSAEGTQYADKLMVLRLSLFLAALALAFVSGAAYARRGATEFKPAPVTVNSIASKRQDVSSKPDSIKTSQTAEELNRLLARPPTKRRSAALRDIIRQTAKSDPVSAINIFNQLTFADRKLCFGDLIQGFVSFDRAEAWEWFYSHSRDAEVSGEAISDAMLAFADSDPNWTLQHVKLLGPDQQSLALAGILDSFERPEQFSTLAANYFKEGKTHAERSATDIFLSRWATAFPAAATDYVKSNLSNIANAPTRGGLVNALLAGLVARSPAEAMRVAGSLPPPLNDTARNDCILNWAAQGSPVAVAEWISSDPSSNWISDDTLMNVGRKLIPDNPILALKLADRIKEDGEIRTLFQESTVHSLAERDFDAALRLIGDQLPAERKDSAYGVAILAGAQDPGASSKVLGAIRSVSSQASRDSLAFALSMTWSSTNHPEFLSALRDEQSVSPEVRRSIVVPQPAVVTKPEKVE